MDLVLIPLFFLLFSSIATVAATIILIIFLPRHRKCPAFVLGIALGLAFSAAYGILSKMSKECYSCETDIVDDLKYILTSNCYTLDDKGSIGKCLSSLGECFAIEYWSEDSK